MKTNIFYTAFAFILISFFNCSNKDEITETPSIPDMPDYSKKWDFNNLNGWVDGSQNMNGTINYSIDKGILKIFTRQNAWDRPKVRTENKIYKTGTYTWKVFIPPMGKGDMASLGAFLYCDDKHELDFEIGYGKESVRNELNAKDDDLIVYMTSQDNPFKSIQKKIKCNKWYSLQIDLTLSNNKYIAKWYIDEKEVNTLNLNYGTDFSFYIFCSMENLKFMGDHIPKQENYGLFDYVEVSQ